MSEQNYTVEEVASICRVTQWTVREWLKNSDHPLNGIKKPGVKKWLIPSENLIEFLKERNG